MGNHSFSYALAAATLTAVLMPDRALAQEYAKGKISRNVYRIPYADSMSLNQGGNDYTNHGGSMDSVANRKVCTLAAVTPCSTNTQCATVGGICSSGYCIDSCTSDNDCTAAGGSCDFVLVSPADGIVCQIIDHYSDCGCLRRFGQFGNLVTILHANAEMTRFLHVKQDSAPLFGLTPGMSVQQGQPVAIEGDVGRTCGGTSPARIGSCLSPTTVPDKACDDSFPFVACDSDADCSGFCNGSTCVGGTFSGRDCTSASDCSDQCNSTSCGRHIHWNITRFTTGEVMNPFTCGIPGNIYQAHSSYFAPCGAPPGGYPSNNSLTSTVLSGFGTFLVRQAHNTISAASVIVTNQASLVLHAGNKITLSRGFRVSSDGYFRAEIETPDMTAASLRPVPAACPCTGATEYCFQWTDPMSPDGVTQGCPEPGPGSGKCHGCPSASGGSGGTRCCPCVGNGDCQP